MACQFEKGKFGLDGERLGKVTETFKAQRPGLARPEGAEGAQQSGELGLQDNSLR